jgi:small-conductance mechanosensitive channel/CRP-like cAMP-binding protein
VGVALLVVAVLVNWLAPKKRGRLRSTVILFGLLVLSHLALFVFEEGGFANMALADGYFGDMVEIFTIINLLIIVLFDGVLTVVGWEVSNIATDLIIGLAYIVALFAGLRHAEVNLSGLIATSAVASGVIGLALAPTIGNILGGVAIQLDGSVGVGDWIQVDANNQGKVKEIRWRHTVVETRNWDTIIVPNATLLSGNILILGKRAGQPQQHRMWVYFNVDFRFPPAQVIDAVNEAVQASPMLNVATDPKPHAICFDLARDNRDSFGYYAVRYWLTDLAVDDPTSSLVRERIYAGLQRAGIPLALPGSAVFLSQDDEEHKARKQAREHEHRVEMLSKLDLFAAYTREELDHLVDRLRFAPFAKGEVMTQEGRAPHWLYILAKGEAEIRVSVPGGGDKRVKALVAPDFFGEHGVMTGAVRGATVLATQAAECYRLEKGDFQKILVERKELAAKMSEVMAHRLTELHVVREHLTSEQRTSRMAEERARLITQVEAFFGLK